MAGSQTSNATLFAAGEHADHGIPGWQAQGVGGQFHLGFGVGAGSGDDGFETSLFFGQLVEISIFFGVGGIDSFKLGLRLHHFAKGGLDFFLDGFGRIKLRLLWQIADGYASQMLDFTVVFLIDPGHDAQHGRFAGTVQAE